MRYGTRNINCNPPVTPVTPVISVTPVATKPSSGKVQAIWGIVCAVISLLFLPPVFGIAGIVLGAIAIKKGQMVLGIVTVVLAAVFMLAGMIFGAYVSVQSHVQNNGVSLSGAAITAFQ